MSNDSLVALVNTLCPIDAIKGDPLKMKAVYQVLKETGLIPKEVSLLDFVNRVLPLDETRDDYLLIKQIRETIYNPPGYVPRPEPEHETCEWIFTAGMYRGERCHGKREKQSQNGRWYCEGCFKKKGSR